MLNVGDFMGYFRYYSSCIITKVAIIKTGWYQCFNYLKFMNESGSVFNFSFFTKGVLAELWMQNNRIVSIGIIIYYWELQTWVLWQTRPLANEQISHLCTVIHCDKKILIQNIKTFSSGINAQTLWLVVYKGSHQKFTMLFQPNFFRIAQNPLPPLLS